MQYRDTLSQDQPRGNLRIRYGRQEDIISAAYHDALPQHGVREQTTPEKTMADIIATGLEEDIVLGRRHPRERLIEQDLCDRFNTHRGDVRLALFELEKKGIVQRIPNRGAIVRDLTPKEVIEIYAVREELEVMAVRILRFPVSPTRLVQLEKIQERDTQLLS